MKQQIRNLSKSVLATALAFSVMSNLSAQEQRSSTGTLAPKIGVKGGVNFSNLYVDDVQSEKMKAGLNLGLFAKVPVTNGFSVQPEILYNNRGSKITFLSGFGGGEYRFNLNYVEVPVLAVFNLGRYFNIHAGPYAAYLTSANVKAEDNGSGNESLVDFNEDNFNRFDYGLAGGIGFDVNNFTIGARYNYGLKEVGKNTNLVTSPLRDSKHSVFNVYVGFGF